MILFHGTIEKNIKNIKKHGLLNTTNDQWITEITQENVCCISNEPTSGEGGSPIHFAGRHMRSINQNGYLVVCSLLQEEYEDKLIVIFDNKELDDYARYHFFLREEFREIGFELYQMLKKVDHFDDLKPILISNSLEHSSKDQKVYYKDLGQANVSQHEINGIVISSDVIEFVKNIGSWKQLYEFLSFHFKDIDSATYYNFVNKAPYSNLKYWKLFYEYFPPQNQKKQWHKWFSSDWLESRKLLTPTKNCQILMKSIEAKYISGFVHVTNSSGIVSHLCPIKRQYKRQARMTLSKRIWRQVYRMLKT